MDTRTKLLILAEESTRRRGFGATSFGDLASAAGIRKASVHHHYSAKSDLGVSLIERHANALGEDIAALSASARTGAEALRGLVALFRDQLDGGESLSLLTALAAERTGLPTAMQRHVADAIRLLSEWLEETFRRGRQDRSIAVPGEFASEAQSALAQLMGAQLVARAQASPAAFDIAVAPLVARTSRH
jgi:TetR/AcrR family transcriptional repressor of nem operon